MSAARTGVGGGVDGDGPDPGARVALDVLAGGPLSTIQDRGRHGLRRLGVPSAGTLAPAWATLANALVGRAPDAPVIECFEGGLRLRASGGGVRVAHAGDADVVLSANGERRALAPWRAHVVPAGAELAVRGSGRARLAVLAIGGLAVPPVLGSASTYARARLGGVDGRALASGDALAIELDAGEPSDAASGPDLGCEPYAPPLPADGAPLVLHAVAGPQHDAFDEAELARFFETTWTLSKEADRMGARLDGPALAHRNAAARDIVSDAILPGSVQVPGSGQPIVMLADAHTAGGYPKIATVVSSDLPRLAVQRPGTRLRLVRIDVDGAVSRVRADARALARHVATISALPTDSLDTTRLFTHNLVDGVVDATAEPLP